MFQVIMFLRLQVDMPPTEVCFRCLPAGHPCWMPQTLTIRSSCNCTQDDMQLAVDFFPLFARGAALLDADPTLYCVSSWNDNGQVRLCRLPMTN